jgi:outer membrane biosynthesis protein TonB
MSMTSIPRLVRLLPFVLPVTVLACGGNKQEPAVASAPPAGALDAVPDASATAPDAGEPQAATSEPSSAVKAESPAPEAAEPKDECTPVGVDFEKRARPKLKECYAAAKKKSPNLEGTVKIKITVDVKGKIKSTKIVDKTLPGAVADCMLKVVKTTPFPEVEKCWDASIVLPITFPTPK